MPTRPKHFSFCLLTFLALAWSPIGMSHAAPPMQAQAQAQSRITSPVPSPDDAKLKEIQDLLHQREQEIVHLRSENEALRAHQRAIDKRLKRVETVLKEELQDLEPTN